MTRIGVSDPLSTTTTVTLAVACANDGAGKPAVYVVQVLIVKGVPQKLTVTAKMELEAPENETIFLEAGGIVYREGSLVFSNADSVISYTIVSTESSTPILLLRSWFQFDHVTLHNVDLLTADVAVVGTEKIAGYVSPIVLNLASSTAIQDAVISNSAERLVNGLVGTQTANKGVVRLSETSFITAGLNGDIRRWESCAGLGHDYTAAVLDTLDPSAPSATCTCPTDKYCMLGTNYDTCPKNTTNVEGGCVPDTGVAVDRAALSIGPCPKGYFCPNNIKTPCTRQLHGRRRW